MPLENAFVKEDLKKQPFWRYAKINSNTFYAHYEDKYFLLKKLFDEFEKTFFDYYDSVGIAEMLDFNPYRNTVSYVDAVIGTKDEMLFLMECSHELMEETIYRVVIEYLLGDCVPDFQKRIGEPKAQLVVKYALGALISFTDYWLHHYDDFTREEIIENFVEMSSSVDHLILKILSSSLPQYPRTALHSVSPTP